MSIGVTVTNSACKAGFWLAFVQSRCKRNKWREQQLETLLNFYLFIFRFTQCSVHTCFSITLLPETLVRNSNKCSTQYRRIRGYPRNKPHPCLRSGRNKGGGFTAISVQRPAASRPDVPKQGWGFIAWISSDAQENRPFKSPTAHQYNQNMVALTFSGAFLRPFPSLPPSKGTDTKYCYFKMSPWRRIIVNAHANGNNAFLFECIVSRFIFRVAELVNNYQPCI